MKKKILQMLLCRNVQKKIIRILPLLIIAIVAILSGIGYFIVGAGWDGLVFLIILMFCAAPMVGCILALGIVWTVYGIIGLLGFQIISDKCKGKEWTKSYIRSHGISCYA